MSWCSTSRRLAGLRGSTCKFSTSRLTWETSRSIGAKFEMKKRRIFQIPTQQQQHATCWYYFCFSSILFSIKLKLMCMCVYAYINWFKLLRMCIIKLLTDHIYIYMLNISPIRIFFSRIWGNKWLWLQLIQRRKYKN